MIVELKLFPYRGENQSKYYHILPINFQKFEAKFRIPITQRLIFELYPLQ